MLNEAGGAAAFVTEIAAALSGRNFEIIVVNDGSTDDTGVIVKNLKAEIPQLRIIEHGENAGQSRALRTGVLSARAQIIAMLDGDGQNDPADIPRLLAALKAGNDQNDLAMVAGERRDRQDTAARKWASNLANRIRRSLLNDGATDTGCGLKVFYREAFLRLPYFDHLHRYLPALMRREGFAVEFLQVSHRARMHGASKYTNFGRFLVAIRDLMGVLWLMARSRSPKSIREVDD
jgi:dolichol-phosphate mannosyltransferase